jgi:hypothetical protein
MCLGVGVDNSKMLAMDPQNSVKSDHTIFCDDADYGDFQNFKRLPALIYMSQFTAATPVGTPFIEIPVSPCYCPTTTTPSVATMTQTYTAALANMFNYWRGSMKYHVQITASSFVTGRLRVAWVPDPNHIPADTADGAGDYISKIWDFTGDSSMSFSIPYLQAADYQSTCPSPFILQPGHNIETCTNGVLQFSLTNTMASTDESVPTVVYVNIWSSAGEDMLFYFPRCPYYTWTSQEPHARKFKSQGLDLSLTHMRELFKAEFPPLVPAKMCIKSRLVHGEEITNFRTLMHRYSIFKILQVSGVTSESYELIDRHESASGIYMRTLSFVESMFLFNRGSRRYKVFPATATTAQTPYMMYKVSLRKDESVLQDTLNVDFYSPNDLVYGLGGFSGFIYQDGTQRNNLEFQVPFYNGRLFRCSKNEFEDDFACETVPWVGFLNPTAVSETKFPFAVYVAAGDDWSVGQPCPPTPIQFIYPAKKDTLVKNRGTLLKTKDDYSPKV